jgi:hypothetical protein
MGGTSSWHHADFTVSSGPVAMAPHHRLLPAPRPCRGFTLWGHSDERLELVDLDLSIFVCVRWIQDIFFDCLARSKLKCNTAMKSTG